MKCESCDRPLATKQDAKDIPPGEGEHLCWGACEPEDWRARALKAEAERDEARAEVERLRLSEQALAGHRRVIDSLEAEVESTKERALSAEREVDAVLRVLNGYRTFPLPSAAMHAKQVLEQLEARIERLTLEVVQHESRLEEARASTESLTAEFQRAVADCDEARAEVERLQNLFQRTHGVHHTWVDSRDKVAEDQRAKCLKAFSAWLREVHATGFPHETPEVLADAVDAGEFSVSLVTEDANAKP